MQKADSLRQLVTAKNDEIARFLASKTEFNTSLYEGLGALLYLFDYARLFDDKSIKILAEKYAQKTIDSLTISNSGKIDFILSGPLGVSAFIKLLSNYDTPIRSKYNNLVNEIDKIAYYLGSRLIDDGIYDFLYGAIGIAQYFSLEITPTSIKFMDKILRSLDKDRKEKAGIYWADGLNRKLTDSNCINLGIAHGLPAILKLLTFLCQKKIHENRAYDILNKAVTFVKSVSSYPYVDKDIAPYMIHIDSNDLQYSNRLGWCYGNLVLSYILFQSAEVLQDIDLKDWSKSVIRSTLCHVSFEDADIKDPYLCHGSSFLIFMYRKIHWDIENDIAFLKQSDYWANTTLEMQANNGEFCNYENIFFQSEQKKIGVLSGLAGLGFAFNSYLGNESKWDSLLMLNTK